MKKKAELTMKEKLLELQNKNEESKVLLHQASNEIKSLRSINERMEGRLRMFDDVMLLVNGRSNTLGGCSPDVVYFIDAYLNK